MATLKNRFAGIHPLGKGLLWAGIAVLLTMGAFALYGLLPDRQSVGALKTLQALQSLSVFILPALAGAYLWSEHPFGWLHLDKGCSWKAMLTGIVLMVVAAPAINLLADWNSRFRLPASLAGLEAALQAMEAQAAALTEQFLQADSMWQMLGNVLLIAVLPALGEEMTFRGTLQQLLTPRRQQGTPHLAIWVTGVLFSAMHLQFYGFVPRMLLGVLFGYMLAWSGTLWLPIVMHLTNNALAVTGAYLASRNYIANDALEQFGTGDTQWIGWLSMGLTLLLSVGLYTMTHKKETPHDLR